ATPVSCGLAVATTAPARLDAGRPGRAARALRLRLCLAPVRLPSLLLLGPRLPGLCGAGALAALLLGVAGAFAALVGAVLVMFLPVFARVLAVIVEVLPRVLAVVVEVVPRVVVHVAAAVPSVRTVVVVVVHGCADGDAGGKSDNGASRGGLIAVVLFLDHHRVRDGLRVNNLRVVLRHVDHLRVGRLDDDRLVSARGRLRLDVLLGCALQGAEGLGLRAQALDAVEHAFAVRRERLAETPRPGDVVRHVVDDLREQREDDEAGLEAGLLRGILQRRARQLG